MKIHLFDLFCSFEPDGWKEIENNTYKDGSFDMTFQKEDIVFIMWGSESRLNIGFAEEDKKIRNHFIIFDDSIVTEHNSDNNKTKYINSLPSIWSRYFK